MSLSRANAGEQQAVDWNDVFFSKFADGRGNLAWHLLSREIGSARVNRKCRLWDSFARDSLKGTNP